MRTSIVTALVLAACGGGRAPTSPIPNNAGGTPVAALGGPWDAVIPGATFTVDNGFTDQLAAAVAVTVTGVDAAAPDTRIIHLAWTQGGAPLDPTSLPMTVTVGPSAVTFDGDEYPLATKGVLPDGRYLDVTDEGRYCYGKGPAPDNDAMCDDICFGELCVHPTHGIVGGSGFWWPHDDVFDRPELRKK